MKQEQAIQVFADIVSPIVGRFLGERVAVRLYECLVRLDKEGTDRLLLRVQESVQQAAAPNPKAP